jgi:hypothetical protein
MKILFLLIFFVNLNLPLLSNFSLSDYIKLGINYFFRHLYKISIKLISSTKTFFIFLFKQNIQYPLQIIIQIFNFKLYFIIVIVFISLILSKIWFKFFNNTI